MNAYRECHLQRITQIFCDTVYTNTAHRSHCERTNKRVGILGILQNCEVISEESGMGLPWWRYSQPRLWVRVSISHSLSSTGKWASSIRDWWSACTAGHQGKGQTHLSLLSLPRSLCSRIRPVIIIRSIHIPFFIACFWVARSVLLSSARHSAISPVVA